MDVNPLLPSAYDITWTVVGVVVVLAHVAFFLGALWSISSSRRLTGAGRLLWGVVVFAFPFVGALAWFAWGRHTNLDRGLL